MEREEVKKAVEDSGLKKKAIAKKVGRHPSVLSQALNGTLPYCGNKILEETSRFIGELSPGVKIISEK